MAPLIILLSVFVLAAVINRLVKRKWSFLLPGRAAMSAMLIFTGINHFIFTDGMVMMLPDFIPFKKEVIYLTGIIEIAAAAGLLLPRYAKTTAWLLIIFFIAILPANIHAANQHVNLQTASYDGNGPVYLWFRVPLQLFFIGWVYYFGIKKQDQL